MKTAAFKLTFLFAYNWVFDRLKHIFYAYIVHGLVLLKYMVSGKILEGKKCYFCTFPFINWSIVLYKI